MKIELTPGIGTLDIQINSEDDMNILARYIRTEKIPVNSTVTYEFTDETGMRFFKIYEITE